MLRDGPSQEMDGFLLHDGYLFRFRKLCIPHTSPRDFISRELHAGGLVRYFGENKTIEAVEHRFYRPSLKRNVAKIVGQCRTSQLVKQQKQVVSPYIPHLYPDTLDKKT